MEKGKIPTSRPTVFVKTNYQYLVKIAIILTIYKMRKQCLTIDIDNIAYILTQGTKALTHYSKQGAGLFIKAPTKHNRQNALPF